MQYFNTKLALLHFTKSLARKFEENGLNAVAVAVNPGSPPRVNFAEKICKKQNLL